MTLTADDNLESFVHEMADEVRAIQVVVGTNPAADFPDMAARLAAVESAVGDIEAVVRKLTARLNG